MKKKKKKMKSKLFHDYYERYFKLEARMERLKNHLYLLQE